MFISNTWRELGLVVPSSLLSPHTTSRSLYRKEQATEGTMKRHLTLGELVSLLSLLATTFAVGVTVGYLLAV